MAAIIVGHNVRIDGQACFFPSRRRLLRTAVNKIPRRIRGDVADNAVEVIKQLREKSPEKYSEIAAKLLAAIQQQPDPDSFDSAKSMRELGLRLLKSIGLDDPTEVEAAVAANNDFIAQLDAIRDQTQGAMQ